MANSAKLRDVVLQVTQNSPSIKNVEREYNLLTHQFACPIHTRHDHLEILRNFFFFLEAKLEFVSAFDQQPLLRESYEKLKPFFY